MLILLKTEYPLTDQKAATQSAGGYIDNTSTEE